MRLVRGVNRVINILENPIKNPVKGQLEKRKWQYFQFGRKILILSDASCYVHKELHCIAKWVFIDLKNRKKRAHLYFDSVTHSVSVDLA